MPNYQIELVKRDGWKDLYGVHLPDAESNPCGYEVSHAIALEWIRRHAAEHRRTEPKLVQFRTAAEYLGNRGDTWLYTCVRHLEA